MSKKRKARESDGSWSLALDLSPGRYEYKFVVEGAWECEPECETSGESTKCVPNQFGTKNGVVEVR